jgi:ribonuclease HII
VYAAAVILDPLHPIDGLKDSKQLTPAAREQLFEHIQAHALAWSFAFASVEEIDTHNILQATLLSMQRAVEKLTIMPSLALIDGRDAPRLPCKTKTIIDGDQLEPAISAASIVAKVLRDRVMQELDQLHPGYGFASNKGYGTPFHLSALSRLGPSIVHRRSFKPVYSAAVLCSPS